MIAHGIPKFLGGTDTLERIGHAMENIGVPLLPSVFWGFIAATTETLGGFLIAIGYQFRIAALFLAFMMTVAALFHYSHGDAFHNITRPIELAIVFFSLIFIGPGKYSFAKG